MKNFAYLSALWFFAQITFAQTTEIQYLSGKGPDDAVTWEFFCTGGRNSGKWTTIPVPSCWELQGFGTYQYGMPFYGKANPPGIAGEQGKYRYKFKLPQQWEGRIIRIVFDGVMTDCEATINQRSCVKLHQGAFYRFKSDITDRIFFGEKENVLEVTASKESANPSVNLAERRADYWNFGGIFRPVFIEALPPQFIDRTAVSAKADGHFHAHVFLGAAPAQNASVSVEFTDANGKKTGQKKTFPVAAGSDRVWVQTQIENIKTWTAETPHLYYATFSLSEGNQIRHTVKERFGFRTVEVRMGDGLYINGRKVTVRGINRHSFRPETGRTLSRRDNYDDVRLIKEMNMNAVRLSHYPPDPDFLDTCDELGLYVMNELGGWHGKYDSNAGKKLVREMVVRDVNHPSIIWWANGNEGGHNVDLDKEFESLDPQKRPVLHPQKNFGGFETMHYRSYGESMEYMRQPEIFMPTEFLHGLYDGGHGAGLWDYWEMMRKHPRCAGGFLWVLADEGIVRTDQNGKIDNAGNYGADGIVGPHHEKEGSFYTVKQIWSPVQVMFIDDSFRVENRYDFTNLKDCRFVWTLKSFDNQEEKVAGTGEIQSPDIAPHASGMLKFTLPREWRKAGALYLSVYDPSGAELWTWDWKQDNPLASPENRATLSSEENETQLSVETGSTVLIFNKKTGLLENVEQNGRTVAFGNGPRFIAARRGDRSMDMYYNHDDKEARSKERIYEDISGKDLLTRWIYAETKDSIVVEANYAGDMTHTRWVITSSGEIRLDYEYQYNGTVELMGIRFDYPENRVLSKRWLGKGPYRVWQNRTHGTRWGIWENDYNDPVPGETFIYPEFKGYFAAWQWLSLKTSEATITLKNAGGNDYLGVYTPRDGRDALLYTLPESGISLLKVIPAVRNKVNATDLIGPSSQAKWVSGTQKGSVYLQFKNEKDTVRSKVLGIGYTVHGARCTTCNRHRIQLATATGYKLIPHEV
jgi:beta-galactosidase/beta-glucuronidase